MIAFLFSLILLAGGTVVPPILPTAVVCTVAGGMTVKWGVPPTALPPAGCKFITKKAGTADNQGQTTGVFSATENDLVTACAPCPVSPGNWGICPYCLLMTGGCAKACPVQVKMPGP